MHTPHQPSHSDGNDPVLKAMAHFRDKQRKQKLRMRAEYFSRPEASAEAEALAARGRGSDSEIAHVTPGEIVLHPSMLSPETLAAVMGDLSRSGVGLGRVSVCSPDASVNPKTGLAEYRPSGKTTWKIDPPRIPDWESKGNQVPQFRPDPSGYNVAPPGNAGSRTHFPARGAAPQFAPDRGWGSSGAIGGFPMTDVESVDGQPTSPADGFDSDTHRKVFEELSPEELESTISFLDFIAEDVSDVVQAGGGAGAMIAASAPKLVPQVVLRLGGGLAGAATLSQIAAKRLSDTAKEVRDARARNQGG